MSLPYDAQRPPRRDYERAADVSADFPMQTSPGGGRHIPLIAQGMSHAARMRANQGFPDLAASPSYGLPMAAQQAPARPMGLPQAAQDPSYRTRTSSSQNFRDSITRTRALRSFKQGRFASLREQGADERSAARQAFGDSQLAAADMQTGGFFEGRQLRGDENTRQNNKSAADVEESGSRSNYNNAVASVGIPAQAAVQSAQADRTQRLLPLEAQQKQAETDRYTHMTPGMVRGADAGIDNAQEIIKQQRGLIGDMKKAQPPQPKSQYGQGLTTTYQTIREAMGPEAADRWLRKQAGIEEATPPTNYNAGAPAAQPPATTEPAEGSPHPKYPDLQFRAARPQVGTQGARGAGWYSQNDTGRWEPYTGPSASAPAGQPQAPQQQPAQPTQPQGPSNPAPAYGTGGSPPPGARTASAPGGGRWYLANGQWVPY